MRRTPALDQTKSFLSRCRDIDAVWILNIFNEEIKQYKEEIEINTKKLNDLRTDKEGLERFAREEYLMKKADEDVFIIKGK